MMKVAPVIAIATLVSVAWAADTFTMPWDVAEWDSEKAARTYAPKCSVEKVTKERCSGGGKAKIHGHDIDQCKSWHSSATNKMYHRCRASCAFTCEAQ